MKDHFLYRLESLFDKGSLWVGSNIPGKYYTDETGEVGEPEGVVLPSSVEEVRALIQVAYEEEIPITPRGGGSGLRGGAVPSKGSFVLSLEKLNKIVDLDKVNYIAKVQPGVITADLRRAAQEQGLYYPINSLSSEISTLGGDVAENAHGLHGVRYGELRDYIRRLDFILPTGEMAHTGAVPMKSVSGYDMNKLFIGSKGTLGIFTEITLKLLPQPETTRTLVAGFRYLKEAAAAASAIITHLLTPSALEILDKNFIQFLRKNYRDSLPDLPIPEGEALLLVEVDGFENSIKQQLQQVENICQNHKVLEMLRNLSQDQEQRLWDARKLWSYTVLNSRRNQTSGPKISPAEDISSVLFLSFFIPPADLEKAIAGLEATLNQVLGFTTLFGHAGEGNLHAAVSFSSNQDFKPVVPSVCRQVAEIVRKFQGLYAKEYFIGISPVITAFSQRISPGLQEVFSQFKKKVDPRNILNPDKPWI
jgi:FAD/FMN-containing dehydrogenase